jgi:two-component system, NtrC family, sensor kinase
MAELAGARTLVIVPMLKENELVGIITIYRQEVKAFTEKQIALVENFTKQAVIAIENTRLLKELRQRTADLSEALTYQTGSANILKVIASSPTDINPVFQAIVESACELCDAYDAVLRLKSGDNLCFSAHHGPISRMNGLSIETGQQVGPSSTKSRYRSPIFFRQRAMNFPRRAKSPCSKNTALF